MIFGKSRCLNYFLNPVKQKNKALAFRSNLIFFQSWLESPLLISIDFML